MNLPAICIKRPVFTIVLSLILIALGTIFFTKLEVRGTPNISFPTISIDASYPGASASFMEKEVTERIEKALKTVKNVDSIASSSSSGSSSITLSFKLDTNTETALSDVRSKVSDVSRYLPEDVSMPSVTKMDMDAWPSFWISITSTKHDDLELTRIAENQIKSVLERLGTVGNSIIFGSRNYSMSIEPINTKMLQHKLTPFEIEKAIRAQNRDYPAGFIKTDSKSFTLKLAASLNSKEEFENIIVKEYKDGGLIRLKDVANVFVKPYDKEVILRYNAKDSIAIGLIKQSTANILQLSNAARAELDKIQNDLPSGVKINIAYDAAKPVQASINSVYFTIFEAIFLVGVVTYLFLGSLKITLIPLVTIPISLIATFTVIFSLGFSINTFTLLAMILAIGLVVDDAIVMLENVYRHVKELGKEPINAAMDASKEIGFAIIAMTLTLASVFLPIGFLDGFLGKLFIEFAWTLAFCVLFSGFVALTLTPMMASRMVSAEDGEKPEFLNKFERLLARTQNFYLKYLGLALQNKKKFFLICASSVLILIVSFIHTNKTFLPDEDQGFLRISYKGPEGSGLQSSLKSVMEAEEVIKGKEGIKGFLNIVGSGGSDSAFAFVPLDDWKERSISQEQIKNELNKEFVKIPGMSIHATNPPSMGGRRGDKAVEFILQSTKDYDHLDAASMNFLEEMQNNPVFKFPDRNFKASTPTLDIKINREKAYRYGVDISTIGRTIQYLISGKTVGDFRIGTNTYDVLIRYNKKDRNQPSDLSKIYIMGNKGNFLPLESVADIVETITVKKYRHYNGQKSIKLMAGLANDKTLNDAMVEIQKIADKILDKNTLKLEYVGELAQLEESSGGAATTFLFALLFISFSCSVRKLWRLHINST